MKWIEELTEYTKMSAKCYGIVKFSRRITIHVSISVKNLRKTYINVLMK